MYSKIAEKENIQPANMSDFISVIEALYNRAAINRLKKNIIRDSLISLRIHGGELESAIQDRALIGKILKTALP